MLWEAYAKLGSSRLFGRPESAGTPAVNPFVISSDTGSAHFDFYTGLDKALYFILMEEETSQLQKTLRTSRACDRCRRQKLKVDPFTTPLM